MDGIHDLGGTQGFAAVQKKPKLANYHEAWEARAHALSGSFVAAGFYNMDEYRHAIERMDPRHYMSASYYERVLTSSATLCVEKGLTTVEELSALAGGHFPISRPSAPGRAATGDVDLLPVGARVRVKSEFVPGHIRMPGYLRGKTGTIVAISPACPFPDAAAHGIEARPQETYDVRFASEDLWPNGADQAFVHAAIFRSYLDLAP